MGIEEFPENGQSNPHLLVGRWGLLYVKFSINHTS